MGLISATIVEPLNLTKREHNTEDFLKITKDYKANNAVIAVKKMGVIKNRPLLTRLRTPLT